MTGQIQGHTTGSLAADQWIFYTVTVPEGSTELRVIVTSSNDSLTVYVKYVTVYSCTVSCHSHLVL